MFSHLCNVQHCSSLKMDKKKRSAQWESRVGKLCLTVPATAQMSLGNKFNLILNATKPVKRPQFNVVWAL